MIHQVSYILRPNSQRTIFHHHFQVLTCRLVILHIQTTHKGTQNSGMLSPNLLVSNGSVQRILEWEPEACGLASQHASRHLVVSFSVLIYKIWISVPFLSIINYSEKSVRHKT